MVRQITADLFKPKTRTYRTRERDAFLLANKGLDAALIADALGFKTRTIVQYQRKLGLRPLANSRKSSTD